MSGKPRRNNYRIDVQNNTAIFEVKDKYGRVVLEFITDADDIDVVAKHTWLQKNTDPNTQQLLGSYGETLLKTIGNKYTYSDGNYGEPCVLARLNKLGADYRKTNIVCARRGNAKSLGKKKPTSAHKNNAVGLVHVKCTENVHSCSYGAYIQIKLKNLIILGVSKTFHVSAYVYAKERAIYAAYLFEKQFYGDSFPEEEYARKEEAFKVLDKAERAEVEDAIVEQLEKLRLARKKIDNYYQSQTLAAKLASGEVVVRPDWKVGNVEESEEDAAKPEPEPEPKPQPQPEPELAAVDYTIKCSKHLLNNAHQKHDTDGFVHVSHTVLKSGSRWISVGSLPKRNNIFNVTFTEGNYTDARAMAIYSAYLFEKLVYGDNFPKAEYNRKLEVIKTLSAKDIEFVNSKVAGKLEKVYTVLKELTSEKSAKSDEPLSTYKIEKSTDELLKQIKQTPLKEDALETAATVDEPTEKYPDIFGDPEVQKAIAEMKQKPSLFQRIKNWFTN
jgi:hypothetical protein